MSRSVEREKQRAEGTGLSCSGRATSQRFFFPMPPLMRLCLSPRWHDGPWAVAAKASSLQRPPGPGAWGRAFFLLTAAHSGESCGSQFGADVCAHLWRRGVEGCQPQAAVICPHWEAPETPFPCYDVQQAPHSPSEDGCRFASRLLDSFKGKKPLNNPTPNH